jgi:hypothetical protein
MTPKKLGLYLAVSAIAASPAGGFMFGLLHAGDPDPNPIGRLFHAFIMAVETPLHGGFPPHQGAGASQSLNVWPYIAVSFLPILSWCVYRDWKSSKKRSELAA